MHRASFAGRKEGAFEVGNVEREHVVWEFWGKGKSKGVSRMAKKKRGKDCMNVHSAGAGDSDKRTDLHLVETLQSHLNAMRDEHDVIGNRLRLWASETAVDRQARQQTRAWHFEHAFRGLTSGQTE